MDSFEWNKILGAFLGAALLVMGIGILSDTLFAVKEPEKPAFGVEVAETEGHGGADADSGPKAVDFGTLLAAANLEKGERAAKAKCASCHTFNKGGPNGTGPNLWGIVGAKTAHLDNFRYSSALANRNAVWSFEEMYKFIEKPQAYIKGTAMSFAGISRQGERIDVIAWLNLQSDAPLALPAPLPAEPAAPEEGAPPADGEAVPEAATPETPAPDAPADGGTPATGTPEGEGAAGGHGG